MKSLFIFFHFQLKKVITTMVPEPLTILKKGLAIFSQKIKVRKEQLQAKLAQKQSISLLDEQWLDHEANDVYEQQVLDALEKASNYERAVANLDENGQAAVKKLREWAGDLAKTAGNKHKSTEVLEHKFNVMLMQSF